MNTYIALLRGINVGGKNSLPMHELASYFEEMGCEGVKTYVQSGNVVFQNRRKLDERDTAIIAKRILQAKGFEPKILLLTSAELGTAIENNPFPTDNGKALHFFFLESRAERPDIAQLESAKADTETFHLGDRVFYLHAPDGVGRSRLAASAEKALGVSATARNWNTVAKLIAMAGLE